MKAAWYESQGPASEVLVVGTMPDPVTGPGEVRIRLAASGINPGDLKKREDAFGYGMSYPRVIPHSDGAGVIDQIGSGVPSQRIDQRVWCFGAQSYRPFGTAAQFTVVPSAQAVDLPESVSFEEGACLGIPAITAHRAVHAGGPVAGRNVLVQGGGGGVGVFAVGLARQAGANVISVVRSDVAEAAARAAGAHHVVRTDGRTRDDFAADVLRVAPDGVHNIVEVALDANIDADLSVLALGGSIAAYATTAPRPAIPFWELLFKNARILLLGSDDFPAEEKAAAASDASKMLATGWKGLRIERTFPLDEIAAAHEFADSRPAGRVLLRLPAQ